MSTSSPGQEPSRGDGRGDAHVQDLVSHEAPVLPPCQDSPRAAWWLSSELAQRSPHAPPASVWFGCP